ncbi:MAG: putative cysteine desulfurase [Syntrophomonadaceae bacterium]|nr:putative cysteine desulfurase [Bacillota bacterium]
MIETQKIRKYFTSITSGRVISNNAATTQAPIQLLNLLKKLVSQYGNVHRGQSYASLLTTERFENSYDTIAQFVGAPSRKNIILYRNATEAINSVMYSLMVIIQVRDSGVHLSSYTKRCIPVGLWLYLRNEVKQYE